jgi:hypothetical protein
MKNGTILGKVTPRFSYDELLNKPDALWSSLFHQGYLTTQSHPLKNPLDFETHLFKVPNQKTMTIYEKALSHLSRENQEILLPYLEILLTNNIKALTYRLQRIIGVVENTGDKKIKTLHFGFYLGLLIGGLQAVKEQFDLFFLDELFNKHTVVIMPIARQKSKTAFIIELVCSKNKKTQTMKKDAARALSRINKLQYQEGLTHYPHVEQVIRVGIAFRYKKVLSAYSTHDLITHCDTEIAFSQDD